MSEATPPDQPADSKDPWGTPPVPAGRPPIARLPTWVNVVLVLTLLASCSAASRAGDAVNQVIDGMDSGPVATDSEVRDMCRLLGAVATKQGIDLEVTFAGGDADTACEAAARQTETS